MAKDHKKAHYCWSGSGTLAGPGPLPLYHHRLLAAQDSTGSADGSHVQVWVVLVLLDRMADAAEGRTCMLIDSSWLLLSRSPLQTTTTPLPSAPSSTPTVSNQPIVANRAVGLRVIGLHGVCLFIPLD